MENLDTLTNLVKMIGALIYLAVGLMLFTKLEKNQNDGFIITFIIFFLWPLLPFLIALMSLFEDD